MKLTKSEIDVLTCPPGRKDCLVFADDLPGFGLRITEAGAKIFIFQYRRGAALRRMSLGKYGDVTPVQARIKAKIWHGQVLAKKDPIADHKARLAREAKKDKKRRERADAEAFTFAKLIDRWETEWLARRRRPSYRREATRALRVNLAKLAELPAAMLDVATVRRAIDAIVSRAAPSAIPGEVHPARALRSLAKRGKEFFSPPAIRGETNARRVRSYGAAMYGWAVKEELVTKNPFAAVRKKGKENARERALNDAEIGEVWRAAGELGWPFGPYVRFLLLTLQRQGEVAGLAWSELSPDLALWELPGRRTKNGQPHLVHLAEPARAVLRAIPRVPGSPLVFTTTGRTAISGFAHAKQRLDAKIMEERVKRAAEAGDGRTAEPLAPWHMHDFRRTGVTELVRKGGRWEVADRLLNHTAGVIRGVAAIYQRYDFLAERESAMTIWAAHVLAAGEGKPPATNVVALRPSAAS